MTLSRIVLVLLTTTALNDAAAQTLRTSAPISNIAYDVTADSAAVGRRQLGVAMTFDVTSANPVVLAIPAWSPGHYVMVWFARRVSRFNAESNGSQLDWRKLDFQTWEIRPRGAGRVRVTFDYLADAVDRAVAWTAPNFAFFNGTNLFLYPVGRGFDWPARVTIHTQPDWRIATGMNPAGTANTFAATNYHDLVDMPFYVGRFAIDSTTILGKTIRLAWYPAASLTPARRDRTFGWLGKIIPAEVAVFGEAPFRNYTLFQRSDTLVNGGGLEHQSSQVDEVLTSRLDAAGNASLYAHEFFHAWNVKRLRPADLVPYRYDAPQQTTWLWVSEGITDYYGALALVRGGITDSAGFFASIASEIATTVSAPPTALSDASLGAWIAPTDGSGGLYYGKGGLAGFLLDIMIRDASDNRNSLDGVMRTLYEKTYKRGRGFTPADWWGEVSRHAAGKSFTEFARRYVDGREPVPLDSVLPLSALQAITDTVHEPRLGVATSTDSTGVRVASVTSGSAGAAAGVQVGDVIISLGDIRVTDDTALDAFRARYAESTERALPLAVRRGASTTTLTLPLRLLPRVRTRVLPLQNATQKALRIRNGILRGVVDPKP
jgi:predicted metalloprotease with PDZ domain